MDILEKVKRLFSYPTVQAGPWQSARTARAVNFGARRAKPEAVPLWQQRRWLVSDGLLQGGVRGRQYQGFYYTAAGRKFQGLIVESDDGQITPYMVAPPLEDIGKHTSHVPCFRQRGSIYLVHLARNPKTVDEAMGNIEALLNEVEQKACRLRPRELITKLLGGLL